MTWLIVFSLSVVAYVGGALTVWLLTRDYVKDMADQWFAEYIKGVDQETKDKLDYELADLERKRVEANRRREALGLGGWRTG